MNKGTIILTLVFVLVQMIGVTVPHLRNIHSNIWPAFALILLVPGVVVLAFLGLTKIAMVLAVMVNAPEWYFGLGLFSPNRRDA